MPLTVLVGENSTGKTSFLALIRAVWDSAFGERQPDFREDPYDLGTFGDLAHHRGGRGGRAESFSAGFSANPRRAVAAAEPEAQAPLEFRVRFIPSGTTPAVGMRELRRGSTMVREVREADGPLRMTFSTETGRWRVAAASDDPVTVSNGRSGRMLPLLFQLQLMLAVSGKSVESLDGSPDFGDRERNALWQGLWPVTAPARNGVGRRPFAGAPVRSRPQRSCEPGAEAEDPEGAASQRGGPGWARMRDRMQVFGRA